MHLSFAACPILPPKSFPEHPNFIPMSDFQDLVTQLSEIALKLVHFGRSVGGNKGRSRGRGCMWRPKPALPPRACGRSVQAAVTVRVKWHFSLMLELCFFLTRNRVFHFILQNCRKYYTFAISSPRKIILQTK